MKIELAASKISHVSSTKANFRLIMEETLHKDVDYDVSLPIDSIQEVNERMKNSLFSYVIGKRLAFIVVEWFVRKIGKI